jgi:aminopeptidase-like protein
MRLLSEIEKRGDAAIGADLYQFASELFPICRSITGEGIRTTLKAIQKRIPMEISEVPSGTPVFDWVVPREWNIRDAYIADLKGNRIVDFGNNNLHVLNYSIPIHKRMTLSELREHLFSIPEYPDWIPYRTSYYREDWGFCLTHNQLLSLADEEYDVCIDSTLSEGHLTYGECYLPGASPDEILISTHACHPSLANDNLSGLVVATELARLISERDRRYSYRFLFLPGTIGAITWLARNQHQVCHIRHGLVLTGIGNDAPFHYKKSRRGDSDIDRAAEYVLRAHAPSSEVMDFSPYGYDERQYCSPGFNLPVGCLTRSVWGTFPQYHTSADNLQFISAGQLADSLRICSAIVDVLENDGRYLNLNPYCEPQLGKRNLYGSLGGKRIESNIHTLLWVLNFSDGAHSLLEISQRSGLPFTEICEAADHLEKAGLLSRLPDATIQRAGENTRSDAAEVSVSR